MKLIHRLFGRKDEGAALYAGIVARGRAPHWYQAGQVPDTIDGRFDMIAAVLSLVILRLEDEAGNDALGVALAERFVDDMDPQLREIGIGDIVVGKHVGRMMSMLGGRLGAYRLGLAEGSLDRAIIRNVFREAHPGEAALAHVRGELMRLNAAIARTPVEALARGEMPA